MQKLLQIFTIKDLRNKVLTVIGLLLAFRVLASVPIPGVDAVRLSQFLGSSQLFGFLNLFSGGGLSNLSLAMLAVGPYITSTIIMQLLTIIFPKFKQLYYAVDVVTENITLSLKTDPVESPIFVIIIYFFSVLVFFGSVVVIVRKL